MRQAIEAVLFPRSLDYDVQGTLIRVFPRKMSTRLFDVNYPNVRRNLQRRIPVAVVHWRPPESVTGLLASSSTERSVRRASRKACSRCSRASGRMHVDRTAGLVQVTDFARRLDQIGRLRRGGAAARGASGADRRATSSTSRSRRGAPARSTGALRRIRQARSAARPAPGLTVPTLDVSSADRGTRRVKKCRAASRGDEQRAAVIGSAQVVYFAHDPTNRPVSGSARRP